MLRCEFSRQNCELCKKNWISCQVNTIRRFLYFSLTCVFTRRALKTTVIQIGVWDTVEQTLRFLLLQDDENAKLNAKIKELEEDRAKLQKTTHIQQTQIEKHRALAEESAKKCDGLQLQVSALHKVWVMIWEQFDTQRLTNQPSISSIFVIHL